MNKIKLLLIVLFAMWYNLPLSAFTRDKLTYRVLSEELRTVEVSGLVSNNSVSLELVVPATVYDGGKQYTVVSIGENAFRDVTQLTSIDMPSVRKVAVGAFYRCNGLNTVLMPNVQTISSSAFYGCNWLKKVDMPQVKEIGPEAFSSCKHLESVSLDNVRSIAGNAFSDCLALQEILHADQVSFIGYLAFANTAWWTAQPEGVCYLGRTLYACKGILPYNTHLVVKSNILSISDYAFRGCVSLASLDLQQVQQVGHESFTACPNLRTVRMTQVRRLDRAAFSKCSALQTVQVGKLKNVGVGAFEQCSALSAIDLHLVDTIENNAFRGCTALTEVNLGNATYVGDGTFAGCTRLKQVYNLKPLSSITSNTFAQTAWYENRPDGLWYIGDRVYAYKGNMPHHAKIRLKAGTRAVAKAAFQYCNELYAIDLNQVETIDGKAFERCAHLSEVDLRKVKSIGDYSFSSCYGLKTLQLQAVQHIDRFAFSECSALTNIQVFSDEPAKVAANAFDARHYDRVLLEVPQGSLSKYQSAETWKNFKQIREMTASDRLVLNADTANIGSQFVLSLSLENQDSIVGFQFDLQLPRGVAVVQEDSVYQIAVVPERTTTQRHVVVADKASNGCVRVICYSPFHAAFSGTSGKVLQLRLEVSPDLVEGKYPVSIKNVLLTNTRNERLEAPLSKADLTVSAYTPGDVNNDNVVNVSDIAGVVSLIMGDPTLGLNVRAADVNYDHAVDVSDISGIVDLILADHPVHASESQLPKK